MDSLAELESMIANVMGTSPIDDDSTNLDARIKRWRRLFGLSQVQARTEIERYRQDLGRPRLSDDLWEEMREAKELEGFDRESYEYSLWQLQHSQATTSSQRSQTSSSAAVYILKLEEPLESVEKVQAAAQLLHAPSIAKGTGEVGDAIFCLIDATARHRVLEWVSEHCHNFRPIIVRLSKSPKELDEETLAPCLGFDTTLPQNRPTDPDFAASPLQDEYPVWYFVYGNLAIPEELQQRLNSKTLPVYRSARVRGGQIRSWRGKYRALVDAAAGDSGWVDGKAYLVKSRDEEDILRFDETEKYEVVRCVMEVGDGSLHGLVFRSAGADEELEWKKKSISFLREV